MITPTSCPLCNTTSMGLVYDSATDYITKEKFQVWQCENCTAAFTIPVPQDLSPYYPKNYRQYNPIILNILKFLYSQRAQNWAKWFKNPGIAFELGCGDGLMLKTLRDMGWKVIGNERTTQAADFARNKLGLPVFVGDIACITPEPIFDLIFLFQVLEHLNDPTKTLQQLSNFIKPGGKIIISVPNFAGWQSKFSREKWFHLDIPRHLHHFSIPAFKTHLKNAGLEIERVSYISLEHDPFGWIQSLLNKMDYTNNRLTRLLMQIDQPNIANISHLLIAILLSPVSLLLSIISWLFKNGAIIEVTICITKNDEEK